jgi:hypothetical protein
MIRIQMGKRSRSVMVAVYGTPCAMLLCNHNSNSAMSLRHPHAQNFQLLSHCLK